MERVWLDRVPAWLSINLGVCLVGQSILLQLLVSPFRVLPYFLWNRKSDLKESGRDGESNDAFPLTPALSPGERETRRTRR
jgi:hypothetical protein